MEHFLDLQKTKIFSSCTEFECRAMMHCFKARFKTFLKNEKVILQGDPMEDVVLVVKGEAMVQHIDTMGNITIISELERGDMYGLEGAFAGVENYKDTLIATQKTLVLFLNKHRIITPCSNRCIKHEKVIRHIMEIVAESHIKLKEKLTHMSKKTTRDKLLSYFNAVSKKAESEYFEIPFNKTELANYLSVDRSAMTTELSKMKDDGIIDFDKNQYRLIDKKSGKNKGRK